MNKRLLLLTITTIMVGLGSTFAQQKGEMAGGIQLNYGTEIESLGIGAKFQYGITDAIRIEPSINYFFGKNEVDMFDFNANVHYLFNVNSKTNLYPLIGLGYTSWKFGGSGDDGYWDYDNDEEPIWVSDGTESSGGNSRTNKIAINLGGGAEYKITEKIKLNAELKYQIISNFNQLVFGIGASYKF